MKQYLFRKIIFCLGLLLLLSQRAQAKGVSYTSQNLRDPFRSPFEMRLIAIDQEEEQGPVQPIGHDLPHLSVQGMIWGTGMPQAIINNSVVKVGQTISEAEILDIRKEGVYLLYQGRQYILRPAIPKNRRGR